MELFAVNLTDESCCFCGRPFDSAGAPVARVWLETPGPARTHVMREHFCHEGCFQQALVPDHRSGSGRPIQRTPDGVILNAAELTPDDLVHQRVLCPGCGQKTFARWPEGWDAHAAHRCAGLTDASSTTRKTTYKTRFGHLFR